MFETLIEAYVRAFTAFIPALFLGAIGFAALRAGLSFRRAATAVLSVASLFGLWLAIAAWAAHQGHLLPPNSLGEPPVIAGFLVGGALLLWGLARFTELGRDITGAAGQQILIGLQAPRIMGGVFLIGWATGHIPWEFALPAGLGDIWAGVAAMQAVRALEQGAADAETKVLRANIIGLADFAVAVVTGLMTSAGFLHVLSLDAPNIINAWPLGLFPAFFVPIFLATHVISLGHLRRARQTAATA